MELISEETIRENSTNPALADMKIICLPTVPSTNSYLKALAGAGAAEGTAVLAQEQTAGRGRVGRSFSSPKGKGVYLSFLLRPALSAQELFPVTALAAVAACNAVERVTGVRPQVKWINDLLLEGKKICGILTELQCDERGLALIIGVGINVGQECFSGELAALAGSLETILGQKISRVKLIAALLEELSALPLCNPASALPRYRRDCVTLGREVRLLRADGTSERVTALDVEEQFGLVVRHASGKTDVVRSGEASVRGFYGYAE